MSHHITTEEAQIMLRLELEDRVSCGIPLFIEVFSTETFGTVKKKIKRKWKIKKSYQRLLIGNFAPKDTDTLKEHGVDTMSACAQPVYIYIRKPTKASKKHPTAGQTRKKPHIAYPTIKRRQIGWECPKCTCRNLPLRPGCEVCGEERPTNYNPPRSRKISQTEQRYAFTKEEQRNFAAALALQQAEHVSRNYSQLHEAYAASITYTAEESDCDICMTVCPAGQGVRLRDCLHVFCRECLAQHIEQSTEPLVPCPGTNCQSTITESEVKQCIPEVLNRSLQIAECAESKSFHCKTSDCSGWCIYEDEVNTFQCTVCNRVNCLTCNAIHEGMNCKQYQDDLDVKAKHNKEVKATLKKIKKMLKSGEAMKCPSCKIVVQKKEGCDWMECTMCKTELCWATRGRRWGPKGKGDTKGGCKCGVNGKRCHPRCQNCH